MKILVTDRKGIESGIATASPYVVISIHDPDRLPARVSSDPDLRAVLTLSFHDAKPSFDVVLPAEIRPFTSQQADAVWDFIDQHLCHVQTIVVHCESGMSRSPGVAAAVCEALELGPHRFWLDYTPNRHVYDTLWDAFDKRVANKGKAR